MRIGLRTVAHQAGYTMNRYAAKLLFQFRVVVGGENGKHRICEELILAIQASSAKQALSQAKKRGKESEYDYKNDDGNPVHFEFVGVMDLLHLGTECQADEVWYDIVERVLPKERRWRFIPPESELHAFRNESYGARRKR
jgi:hypothetical protein